MPSQLEALTKRVATETARRRSVARRNVVWEPTPLYLWFSFWAFASRDATALPNHLDLDLDGWRRLLLSLADAESDDAALETLIAWAGSAYCGAFQRCTPYNLSGPTWQGPKAYDLLRDIVTERRHRAGQTTKDVPWLEDDAITAEGRALVLAELSADRASGELRRLDPWERFYESEESS